MSRIEKRLAELGLTLPTVPKPVAAYIPAVRTGNIVVISGQLPMVDGALPRTGAIGNGGVSVEEGAALAKTACLNGLAAIKSVIGDLDKVVRIVRVACYVASKDDFTQQSLVANGASTLLQDVFGEAGKHVRTSLGQNVLPLGSPVEVELWAEVKD